MVKGRVVYPILFILLCLSIYFISMIETSGSVYPEQKKGEYRDNRETAAELFPESNYIRVYFQRLPGETAFEYYREIDKCADYFNRLEWPDMVVAATRIQDINTESMQFNSEKIYNSSSNSAESLDYMLHEVPLFSQLFLSNDRTGSYIYIFYPEDSWEKSFYHDIDTLANKYQDRLVFPMGITILEKHISFIAETELGKLGIIAVFVVLLIEIVFFRSILFGLLFSLVSFIPPIYVMSLFPLFNIEFSVMLIPVPILTMVLSTTYTLHIVSYAIARPNDSLKKNLVRVLPVVSAAAATTLFGFATMLFSSLGRIQELGILMLFGVLISMAVAWLVLPSIIPCYLKNKPPGKKLLNKIPISKCYALGFLLLLIIGISGIFKTEDHRFYLERTVRTTPLSEYIKNSRRVTGASDQFFIIIDTGEEYGFVSLSNYRALLNVRKELAALPYSGDMLSITDLADWINGKIEGSDSPIPPEDEMEIGESLELLFSSDSGLNPESLITQDYSAVRFQLLVDASQSNSWKSNLVVSDVKDEIYSIFKKCFPEAEIIVLSDSIGISESLDYVRNGILNSLLLFYPIVFLFLAILFKSPLSAAIAIIPSLSSALLYIGLIGYLGFYFSLFASVYICMLIGVSIDDSVVLVQFFLTHKNQYKDTFTAMQESLNEVGSVIIRTTVIIISGVSVLLLSSYREAVQNTMLVIVCFSFATLLTLFFIPVVFLINKKKKVSTNEK